MQKFFVTILALVFLVAAKAHSETWSDYENINSSFSDQATNGPVLVSTIPLRWVSVTLSSPAANGYIAFYRSTGTIFDSTIASQTVIPCNWQSVNTTPAPIDMWGLLNTSSTWVSRFGNCTATLFFTWPEFPGANEGNTQGFGLPITGKRDNGQLPNN